MHLDEERLQRLAHGELSEREESLAQEHLAACEECRSRLSEMGQEETQIEALLRQLDVPAPRLSAAEIADRAEAKARRPLRWVAGLVLAVAAAGAAYAMPGSPLPRWADALAEWIGIHHEMSSAVTSPGKTPEPHVAGIAVAPGQQFLILFRSPQAKDRIRVSLTNDAEVVVRAPAGAATFTTETDQLVIDNRDSTVLFDVQIPRTAPRVEIRVAGDRIFLKEGPRTSP